MNIAIDATAWQNTRGYGRHARSLLTALASINTKDRFVFFVDSPNDLYPFPDRTEVRRLKAKNPAALAASAEGYRSMVDMWTMSQALSTDEFDIVFFPTVYSYVPVFSRSKKVLMIHDVIAEKFPQLTLPKRRAKLFWQMKVALARWQADAVATVSEYSRHQLTQQFNLPPERVTVIGEASDPIFRVIEIHAVPDNLLKKGVPPSGKFVVYVGGFGPHKNLDRLVDVFQDVRAKIDYHDLYLIFVGDYKNEVFHSHYQELVQQVELMGVSSHVIFTGYLPDDELVQMLNVATVLVLPSLMEGFGLPAVEAAACGCPVIATRESPLPGLLGEAGLFIDPNEPTELMDALIRVLVSTEQQDKMRCAGLRVSQSLTWENAANQLNILFQKVSAG